MANKKIVYKIGNSVIIRNPEIFVRCGYPLTKDMAVEEVKKIVGFNGYIFPGGQVDNSIVGKYNRFIRENLDDAPNFVKESLYEFPLDQMANLYLQEKRWGGEERRVYTELKEEFRGIVGTVYQKRVVKSGTYVCGSGGYSYEGEYDYDPPYLANVKSHIILSLMVCIPNSLFETESIEIEECNVELENPAILTE